MHTIDIFVYAYLIAQNMNQSLSKLCIKLCLQNMTHDLFCVSLSGVTCHPSKILSHRLTAFGMLYTRDG